MRVVSRTVERHRDTTFDKERHAAIAPVVRDDAEGTRRADEEASGALATFGRGQSAEGGVHDGGKRRRLPSLASLTVGSVGSSFRSQSLHVTCLWRWSSPSQ